MHGDFCIGFTVGFSGGIVRVMATEDVGMRFTSDKNAHEHAMSMSIAQVVQELEALLGATMVAEIGGVSETRAVAQWKAGREPQRPHVLRFALQIAVMIVNRTDQEIARAWFHGSNPHLEDASPLALLRDRRLSEIQGTLLRAAREFATRRDHDPE